MFSEVLDGVEHQANTKIQEGQSKMTYVRPHIYINKYPQFSIRHPPLYSVSLAHQIPTYQNDLLINGMWCMLMTNSQFSVLHQ